MEQNRPLDGKKALIVGVANEKSLAWAIARHLHGLGARLGFTYQNERLAERVRTLATSLESEFIEPCDVTQDGEIERLFSLLGEAWDQSLDILIHAVAFAKKEDLDHRYVDTSRGGFAHAMDVSVYSLLALARAAEPLMKPAGGGTILTLTYYGSQRVIPNYNVMGVAKAALESSVRYLAYELGPAGIRVHAISAGPIRTLAASGIKDFKSILSMTEADAPLKRNIDSDDVGALGAFLCSPGAKNITGSIHFVDAGINILGLFPGQK